MPRYRDRNWELPDQLQWDLVPIAILMDIREELQKLNRVFACPNFQDVPSILRMIKMYTRDTSHNTDRKRQRRLDAARRARLARKKAQQ